MIHARCVVAGVVVCLLFLTTIVCLAGCGIDRLDATLPAEVKGFTLSDLESIQDDERLTDDEKREQIREAVGAPDSEGGDRLVEFLLDFNVP